jgi:hypothetical protein
MAVKRDSTVQDEPRASLAPPPVPDGEQTFESLGNVVDRLVGTARLERQADKIVSRESTAEPKDPPPSEEPPPVPDGDDVITRGR